MENVCKAHNVPLKAAALQFVLAHPAVVTNIPGARTQAQLAENIDTFKTAIPARFWSDLKGEGLIRQDAPTPA
jgi:D-threo-aldose 1-dehydrogenase